MIEDTLYISQVQVFPPNGLSTAPCLLIATAAEKPRAEIVRGYTEWELRRIVTHLGRLAELITIPGVNQYRLAQDAHTDSLIERLGPILVNDLRESLLEEIQEVRSKDSLEGETRWRFRDEPFELKVYSIKEGEHSFHFRMMESSDEAADCFTQFVELCGKFLGTSVQVGLPDV